MFYRDGCGDGQLPLVKNEEVPAVLLALKQAGEDLGVADYAPKLTFTIVTKRVNMRFFVINGQSLVNPLPGTVVDDVVTRPERFDFYMVPQFVNQGTVTPVNYNIIHDDNAFTPDQHHKLAF